MEKDKTGARGNIFNNNKEHERQPDMKGDFEVPVEMLEAIKQAPRRPDGSVKLRFAGWWRDGPKAGKYLSGVLSLPLSRQPDSQREAPKSNPRDRFEEDADDPLPF